MLQKKRQALLRKQLKLDVSFDGVKKDWETFSLQLFETSRVFRESHFKALKKEIHIRVSGEWHMDMRAWWEFKTSVFEKQIKILKDNDLLRLV